MPTFVMVLFGMSPQDAANSDPKARIFLLVDLQTLWKVEKKILKLFFYFIHSI